MLANCIFRVIYQIFDSPIIPRIQYTDISEFFFNFYFVTLFNNLSAFKN